MPDRFYGFCRLGTLHIGRPQIKAAQAAQFAIPTALCSSKTGTRNEKVKQSFAASSVQQDPVKDKDVRRKQIKCYYCSGSHHIRICPEFTSLSVQERNQWVATKKVCQWCFSATHSLKDCKRKKLCGKNGCTEKHDSLCHVDVIAPAPVVGATSLKTATTIMKTVAIDVFDREGKTHRCVAYLDEGSAISLVDEQLIQELELQKGERTSLKMKTLSGLSEQTSFKVDLHIVSVKDGRRYSLTDVYTMSSLSIDGQAVRMTKLEQQFPEIGSLEIPDFTERPKILIGVDHIDLIATRQLRRVGGANGPLLQRTKLGWTLTGKVIMTTCLQDSTPVNFAGVDHDPPFDQMDALVRSTWKTECFGTKYKDSVPRSREDRLAMSILRNEVFHDGERWVAPLLRRSREEELPRSRDMAERRAISFEKRLDRATAKHEAERKKGPSLSEMTFSRMEKMLKDGHFRKLSRQEASHETQNTWYLPLHAVTNPNKPGKVRLVLDAAAKSGGKCLNDLLLSGPDFFNSIPGILLRWREKKIALTSDVVAMFSQVVVAENDRQSQRFLWRGERRAGPFDVYESPRLMFGATSSPSTAEYCYQQTADLFSVDLPDVKRAIKEDTYVDDILSGTDDISTAVQLVHGLVDVLRRGGFELAPFSSNSPAVIKAISAAGYELSRQEVRLDSSEFSTPQRALGILWKTTSDDLAFQMKPPSETPTKRTVLSQAMTVFDPIGFLCGWLLRPKILMQRLWQRGLDWDDEIPSDLVHLWDSWVEECTSLADLTIPRYVFSHGAGVDPSTEVDLHTFCDASEDGFAAVSYYRWTDTSGNVQVSLAYARARLAPVKRLTIPRLELQAAVLGTRIAEFIKRETRRQIAKCSFWTDSKNVLAWIKSTDQRFQTFVANRLAEIHDVTDEEVLTPFHFLIGRATASYPPGSFNDDDLCLRRRWRYSQRLTDHFWKRWLKEYLPTLHRRVKWQQGGRPVRKNDIVIIVDDQHPRGVWPRGIVEEVYRGFDGAVRNVLIKTKNGHLRRPVRKVIVLDTFTTSCEGPEC